MYACGVADVECTCAAPCLQAVYKLNKVIIFVFFVHKQYSHSFIKLSLNH